MIVREARRMGEIDRTLIRRIHDAAPPGSLNLGLGQPDLPTPARIALSGIDAIAKGRTAYTSTGGDPAVRSAIAARYAPHRSRPDEAFVSVGSQEAVFATMLTLLDPGDEVLVPDPGYPAYPVVARLVGAVAIPYPVRWENAFRVDPDDLGSRLTPRTRLAILCSPSNPTGAVDRADDLVRVAALLDRHGVAYLSDEVYAGFAYDRPAPSIGTVAPEGGVVVSGLSKDLSMTGWRIGWAVGPAAIIARIVAAHQYIVTCASSVSQGAALAALSPEANADREAYLEIFRRRRATMGEALGRIPGIRYHFPEGAFYFFVDVSAHGDSIEIAERVLARRKVITIPGEAFGPGGKGYLRISFAASEDEIVSGIRAIGEELGSTSR